VDHPRSGRETFQITIQKSRVADFIDCVAGYVLRAIAVEIREGSLIGVPLLVRVYLNRWIIADTAQFRILCPEVAFDKLGRSQESKDAVSPLVNPPPLS
jgi:hypothetical protein